MRRYALIIVSDSFYHSPTIVDSERIEHFWRMDSAYLTEWEWEPRDKWFLKDVNNKKIAFIAGLASLDGRDQIGFINGRHRTRWLLNKGIKELPVCIPTNELEAWMERDLIIQTKQPIVFPEISKLIMQY